MGGACENSVVLDTMTIKTFYSILVWISSCPLADGFAPRVLLVFVFSASLSASNKVSVFGFTPDSFNV